MFSFLYDIYKKRSGGWTAAKRNRREGEGIVWGWGDESMYLSVFGVDDVAERIKMRKVMRERD